MATYSTTTTQPDLDGFGSKGEITRSTTISRPGNVSLSTWGVVARGGAAIEGEAATTDHNLEHRMGQYVRPDPDIRGL